MLGNIPVNTGFDSSGDFTNANLVISDIATAFGNQAIGSSASLEASGLLPYNQQGGFSLSSIQAWVMANEGLAVGVLVGGLVLAMVLGKRR